MPAQSFIDVLVSPSMDSKLRDRAALYKRKNQSPKFRDVLRERCHSRIKASRRALLDEFRLKSNPGDVRNVLLNIVREEIRTLKEGAPDAWEDEHLIDLPGDEFLLDSSTCSEDQWIIQEYEKVLQEEEATFSREWENEVICPLCERSSLTETMDDSVVCPKCHKRFPDQTSLGTLREILEKSVLTHNLSCDEKSQFALISENDAVSLYQLCDSCGLFVNLS